MIGVAIERPPEQVSRPPPVIEHDALRKRLASGGDCDDIMLGVGSRIGFGPVELERFQLLRIQPEE